MIDGRLWRDEKLIRDNNEIINNYIQISRQKKQIIHTTSFCYALSEYYGNWSRLEFYFCKIEEEKYFEQSINGFLEAAYFSLQNDNAIRYSYWLCHAARSYARLGKISDARTVLKIAEAVTNKLFNITDNFIYKRGIKSICYLVKSEISLCEFWKKCELWKKNKLTSNDQKFVRNFFEGDIVNNIISAIFGFYVTGFERLIFDSLYSLHKFLSELQRSEEFFNGADEYGDEYRAKILRKIVSSVSKQIENVFIEKDIADTILVPLSKIIICCNRNDEKLKDDKKIAEIIAKLESDNSDKEILLSQQKELKKCFSEYKNVLEDEHLKVTSDQIEKLSDELKNKVKDKWDHWFEDDSNSYSKKEHPVCKMIESKEFLSPFFSSLHFQTSS
jgi:hypothetical protein